MRGSEIFKKKTHFFLVSHPLTNTHPTPLPLEKKHIPSCCPSLQIFPGRVIFDKIQLRKGDEPTNTWGEKKYPPVN